VELACDPAVAVPVRWRETVGLALVMEPALAQAQPALSVQVSLPVDVGAPGRYRPFTESAIRTLPGMPPPFGYPEFK
jgi:hypothetical protein